MTGIYAKFGSTNLRRVITAEIAAHMVKLVIAPRDSADIAAIKSVPARSRWEVRHARRVVKFTGDVREIEWRHPNPGDPLERGQSLMRGVAEIHIMPMCDCGCGMEPMSDEPPRSTPARDSAAR